MHFQRIFVVCGLAISFLGTTAAEGFDKRMSPPLLPYSFKLPYIERWSGVNPGVWTGKLDLEGFAVDLNPRKPGDAENCVSFSGRSTAIDETRKVFLRRHAFRLKQKPSREVTLVAYTDSTGSTSYSVAIAEERLEAVAAFLRGQGVARGQIARINAGRKASLSDICRTSACCREPASVELVYEESRNGGK